MRIVFAIAAPFALAVAGCQAEPNEPDDRVVDTGDTAPSAVDVELPDVPVETPSVTTTATATTAAASETPAAAQ